MAHHKSAQKRILRNARKAKERRGHISSIRTMVKNVEMAIGVGDKASAENAFKLAEPSLQAGVTKGILHKNTAARTASRLAQKIRRLG